MTILEKFTSSSYVLEGLVLSGVFLGLGALLGFHFALWVGAVLMFATVDALGYHYLLTKNETVPADKTATDNAAYRIIQGTFQVLLASFLATFSWPAAWFFILTWWMSTCDWLYYLILKQEYKYDDMFWLNWSLPGIICKILGIKTSYRWMIGFSVAAIVFCGTLLLIF